MQQLIKPPTTEDQAWTPKQDQAVSGTHKPVKPLTRKQAAFVRHLLDHPKEPAINAAKAAYGKPDHEISYRTANAIATENLQKPAILTILSLHSANAEDTLIEVMNKSKEYALQGGKDGASYAAVAVNSANSVLDRVHGKATIKQEVTSTSVVLNIDLTGVTETNK
jgi:hypothetical protein